MKNMNQANELNQAPLPGKRISTCIAAESGVSNKQQGISQIVLRWQIDQGQDGGGAQCDDYLITDGAGKGAGMARRKLRGLLQGSPFERVLDSDEEISDEAITQYLFGQKAIVEFGNEPMMAKGPTGQFDKPMKTKNATGLEVPLMKLTVLSYSRHQISPPMQAQPQQQQQQFQPQQQFAQQPAPYQQFAQQPQQPIQQAPFQQLPPQPIQQPQQASMQPAFAGQAPMQPAFAGQAQMPWGPPAQSGNGAPPQAPAQPAKRKRTLNMPNNTPEPEEG